MCQTFRCLAASYLVWRGCRWRIVSRRQCHRGPCFALLVNVSYREPRWGGGKSDPTWRHSSPGSSHQVLMKHITWKGNVLRYFRVRKSTLMCVWPIWWLPGIMARRGDAEGKFLRKLGLMVLSGILISSSDKRNAVFFELLALCWFKYVLCYYSPKPWCHCCYILVSESYF